MISIDWDNARGYANQVINNQPPRELLAAVRQAQRIVDSTYAKLQNAETMVTNLEVQLKLLSDRWNSSTPEYQEIKKEFAHRRYRLALDELERLVVSRLFELTKLNASGTGGSLFCKSRCSNDVLLFSGYKMRRQIAKALQRRSDAIRTALRLYNEQAALIGRPGLTWKDIVDYGFLAEFDLLRHSRDDVRERTWAKPACREATIKHLTRARAQEEILRLNVEIRRLYTAIHDEANAVAIAIAKTDQTDPALAAELKRQWSKRSAVNAVHVRRLQRVAQLPGFSGVLLVGTRLGSGDKYRSVIAQGVHTVAGDLNASDHDIDVADDNSEVDADMANMMDFMLALD